jgi:hypothetical protein
LQIRTFRRQSEIYCRIDVSALFSVFYVLFLLTTISQSHPHNHVPPIVQARHARPPQDVSFIAAESFMTR